MTKDNSPPAFPSQDTGATGFSEGMTLREWYAGRIISGMLSGYKPNGCEPLSQKQAKEVAGDAFIIADAMIAAEAV